MNNKNSLSMNKIIEPLKRSCTIDIEHVSNQFNSKPVMECYFAKHQWVENYNVRMKKQKLISVLGIDLKVDDDDSKFNVEIQKWNDAHLDEHDQISLINRKYTDETFYDITGLEKECLVKQKDLEWNTECEEEISNIKGIVNSL